MDPDSESEKLVPDPHSSQNLGALEAQNGAVEGHGGVKAQNGALEEPSTPVVADSHDFDQEPDPIQHLSESRIWFRILAKSWIRIRIIVMRIRNPAFMLCLYDWTGSWPTVWPAPSSAPLTILGGTIILKTTDVANKG